MSKNQTTWLTVALLQLGSVGVAHNGNDPRLSLRTVHAQDGEFLGTTSNREYLKHPVTNSCEIVEPGKIDDAETFELIWNRAVGGICESISLKKFLKKLGKLVSVSLISSKAVAELEFDHPDHVSKAEKSWKVIAASLQHMLGNNIELRINLAKNGAVKSSKKPYLGMLLSSCS